MLYLLVFACICLYLQPVATTVNSVASLRVPKVPVPCASRATPGMRALL